MSSVPTPPSPQRDDLPQQTRFLEQPPVINSVDLFAGQTEIRVRHRGDEYRLRITRQGKLILTK